MVLLVHYICFLFLNFGLFRFKFMHDSSLWFIHLILVQHRHCIMYILHHYLEQYIRPALHSPPRNGPLMGARVFISGSFGATMAAYHVQSYICFLVLHSCYHFSLLPSLKVNHFIHHGRLLHYERNVFFIFHFTAPMVLHVVKSGLDVLSIISATVTYVLPDHSIHVSIQIFGKGYNMLHRNMSSSVIRREFHRSGHPPRHHNIFYLDPFGPINVGSSNILCRGSSFCSLFLFLYLKVIITLQEFTWIAANSIVANI